MEKSNGIWKLKLKEENMIKYIENSCDACGSNEYEEIKCPENIQKINLYMFGKLWSNL